MHFAFFHLHPKSGDFPNWPFGECFAEIAQRARAMLAYVSEDKIRIAIWFINWVLERYFEQAKTPSDAVNHESTEAERDNATGSRDYVSEVWALKQCYDRYKLTDDSGFEDAKDHHYFAVLALLKLDQAIGWVDKFYFSGESTDRQLHRDVHLSLAGTSVIEAMDAVCFAEYLLFAESTRLMLQNTKRQIDEMAEEKARQHISFRNKRAVIARHALKTYPVKTYAMQLYLERRQQYKSPMHAAKSLLPEVFAYAKQLGGNISEGKLYRYLLEAKKLRAIRAEV